MKRSPIQLKWVTYPRFSYETRIIEGHGNDPVSVRLTPEVRYISSGEHTARLAIESNGGESDLYSVSLEVYCSFDFDLSLSKGLYRNEGQGLPFEVATNVISMLYSGAREFVSTMTARAPHGSIMLEALTIQISDVKITSDQSPEVIYEQIFKLNDPAFLEKIKGLKKVVSEKGKKKKRTEAEKK